MSIIEKIKDYHLWEKFQSLLWWQKILVVFGLFLLFFVFIDLISMPLYTRHGSEYELPDVTEKQIDEANKILDDNGFLPIVQDSAYDSFYPPGTVIRQNPVPFATVKKGRRVYLVVSSGERPIYMPDLIKESLTNAELRLREAGLELNKTFWEYSEEIPYRGVVIKQSAPPGEQVMASQKINLTVSLGTPPSSFEIPRLVGKSLESALNELEAVDITRDRVVIKSRYQPKLVPQTIISQSIKEGTPVIDVDVIELVISTDRLPDQDSGER
jgi:serine/threonine-protein kinase